MTVKRCHEDEAPVGYGCGPSDTGVLSRLPAGKKPHQAQPYSTLVLAF